MIQIGLSGWGDHDDLYPPRLPARDKLSMYARYFSMVEVDSSFYAIQNRTVYERWLAETPKDFTFVMKAYQGMTGHMRGKSPFATPGEMFQAYLDSVQPMVDAGRLKAVLFQFPPWFDCVPEHIRQLRAVRKWMGDLPLALEFRHQSWFASGTKERTLEFMREEGWIHVVCDEPQIGSGSVPTVLQPTSPILTLVRLHGRNAAGWSQGSSPRWRELRNLYRYSREELLEWQGQLQELLAKGTREICMVFNNNSGGDAAGNALEMREILGMPPRELPPRQMDLFAGRETE